MSAILPGVKPNLTKADRKAQGRAPSTCIAGALPLPTLRSGLEITEATSLQPLARALPHMAARWRARATAGAEPGVGERVRMPVAMETRNAPAAGRGRGGGLENALSCLNLSENRQPSKPPAGSPGFPPKSGGEDVERKLTFLRDLGLLPLSAKTP